MKFLNSLLCVIALSALTVSCSDSDEEAAELRSEITTVKEETAELADKDTYEDQIDGDVIEEQIEDDHADHEDHDAERQFLINTLLDLGPGDAPEVVECVVDLIVDLSGLDYIEIEQMFLGLIVSELDPYLESERFRQDCDAGDYSYYSHEDSHEGTDYSDLDWECESGEQEMCWEWTSDASQYGCGPSTETSSDSTQERLDHEHCWVHKIYWPYVSLDPSEQRFEPLDNETRELAQQLEDFGWNRPLDTPATYYLTSDLSSDSLEIVKKGIQAAEEYLGSYGPMRVYVIGSDTSATDEAIEDYCSWAYDSPAATEWCPNDQGVAIYELAYYEGSNAFAQHSRLRSSPTQSFVIGNPIRMGDYGAKIAAHEYVHIFQNAHNLYMAADRFGLDSPIWMEEGAAEFLALYLADQKGWISFEQEMAYALEQTQDLRALVPDLTIQDLADDRDRVGSYCGLCFGVMQYAIGQWATAWLVNQSSLDDFFFTFYPNVYELGVEGAFEEAFGLTMEEFYVEFEEFLNLPADQQMAILPNP